MPVSSWQWLVFLLTDCDKERSQNDILFMKFSLYVVFIKSSSCSRRESLHYSGLTYLNSQLANSKPSLLTWNIRVTDLIWPDLWLDLAKFCFSWIPTKIQTMVRLSQQVQSALITWIWVCRCLFATHQPFQTYWSLFLENRLKQRDTVLFEDSS